MSGIWIVVFPHFKALSDCQGGITSAAAGSAHHHPSPKTGGSGRNQRNNPYQLEELFIKFHRTPAGIAWRWRTELLTLSVLAAAWWRLDTWTSLIWAGVILGRLAAIVAAVPHPRRFITRRFWCVLARHRLQRLCYEARPHTRSGRLPLILYAGRAAPADGPYDRDGLRS